MQDLKDKPSFGVTLHTKLDTSIVKGNLVFLTHALSTGDVLNAPSESRNP